MNLPDRIQSILILLVLAMPIWMVLVWLMLAPVVLIDVEIYEHRESGDMIHCATGSLTPDPPWRHVGSGAVPDGDESYC